MRKSLSSSKQIKWGALLSYIAIGVNIITALIYSPWMLSQIGSGDYGLYTLATSLINMFLLDFGMSSAVTRFVSKYLAEGRQDSINNLLGIVYKIFGIMAACISVCLMVVYFLIDSIYIALTPEEIMRFKVVYIIAATFSVISFPFSTTLNGILTSYEKFVQMKLCDVANKVITVLLIVIALFCGYGLYELVFINAAINLVVFGIKIIVLRKTTAVQVNFGYWDRTLLKEIFGFSVWVLVNSICSRLIMNICPSILGITCGTMAITLFSFASTIENYAYTFSSALDGLFMPKIARITYGENDTSKVLPLMIKVGRFQYHLVGLILIGFMCVGKEFIRLWIGSEYSSVFYCAVLLLLPAPFYLSQQIAKNTMIMVNKVRYLTCVNLIKALMNVILVPVLSIKWGTIGACLSICIVYFFRNFANMYLYKHKLEIDTRRFYFECYGKMSISMLLTLLVGVFLQQFFCANNWIELFVKIILIIGVYLVCMWIVAYNDEEKRVIIGLMKLNRYTKKKEQK